MRYAPLLILALTSTPVFAGGEVDVAERGIYACELPGNAAGSAGVRQPDVDFRIRSASRYKSEHGEGVYLRQGNVVRFTSGPRAGETWQVISPNVIRKREPDGSLGRMRCIRSGR